MALGGFRMLRRELRAGSCGANSGANIATSTTSTRMTLATIAVPLRQNRRRKLLGGGSVTVAAVTDVATLILRVPWDRNSRKTYLPQG